MRDSCKPWILLVRADFYESLHINHLSVLILMQFYFGTTLAASPDSPIYVHCKAGKSRSVTATIAYLITQLHWPLNKAYNHVLTQRPCMCPNIGFVTELMRMEERTLGTERAGGLVRAGSLNSILSLSTAGSGHTYAHHHHHHSLNLGSPKVLSAKNSLSNMSSMSNLTTMAMAPQMH